MKTLVAVDGSEASFSALATACRIARRTGHYVTAMYVNAGEEYTPEETGWPAVGDRIRAELESRGEDALRRAVAVGRELGVAVEGIMAYGVPAAEIASYVAAHGIVKLIVLGHSSKGRGTQGFVQSTARAIIAAASRPAVLVTSASREIGRILVAADGSEAAMRAAVAAANWARALGARLRLISTFPADEAVLGGYRRIAEIPDVERRLLETQEQLRGQATAAVERARQLVAPLVASADAEILEGQAADVVLAESRAADLTVIGVKRKPERNSIGRMATKLLEHPEISLLCVQ